MKRITSVFKKEKDRNSSIPSLASAGDRKNSLAPAKNPTSNDVSDGPDHSMVHASVAANLEKFASVVHAANRPLPTGTGDGSYVNDPKQSGLFDDLKAMKVKDFATLNQLFIQHISDSELTDDKTMVMERVIQVQ